MPEATDTLEKAQAGAEPKPDVQPTATSESPAGDPPKGAEQPKADATPKPAEARVSVAEFQALQKQLAKTQADFELTRKALSSRDRADAATKKERETEVRLARVEAVTNEKDPDAAERAVRETHQKDDQKQAADQDKAWQAAANERMGASLTKADLDAKKDWLNPKNKELRAKRGEWLIACANRDDDWVAELEAEVEAMKKEAPTPAPAKAAEPPAPKRSAAERSRSMDDDGGPPGGGSGLNDASYRAILKDVKPLPSASEIDRMTANWLKAKAR